MSWLRAIFNREPRLPAISSTSFGRTITQLAAADDPAERKRLGELLSVQLEGYLSSQAGNTFVAILELEGRIQAGQGETNEMISEAVNLIRGTGAAVDSLRAEFRDGLSAFGERLSGLEATVAEHDKAIQSFYASRQRSTERHDETQQQIGAMAQTLDLVASEFDAFRSEIRALLAQTPPEERARYLEMIERHDREIAELRAAREAGG